MSGRHLKPVPPRPDDAEMWRRALNFAYLAEQDALFRWLKDVQAYVERAEREKRRRAA